MLTRKKKILKEIIFNLIEKDLNIASVDYKTIKDIIRMKGTSPKELYYLLKDINKEEEKALNEVEELYENLKKEGKTLETINFDQLSQEFAEKRKKKPILIQTEENNKKEEINEEKQKLLKESAKEEKAETFDLKNKSKSVIPIIENKDLLPEYTKFIMLQFIEMNKKEEEKYKLKRSTDLPEKVENKTGITLNNIDISKEFKNLSDILGSSNF